MVKLRNEDLVWQDIEGEVVILDLRGSVYLTVKGSGALLWPHLIEGTSKEDLIAVLVRRYAIDEEQAAHGIESFISDLVKRKLVDI